MIRFYDKQDYEEKYGEEVGSCNRHKITVVDNNCDLCEDELGELWQCKECLEIRVDDARVESGMKCGVCAYG